ncbi:MAG: hypothetical protein GWP61_24580 [Chloroflexi bacterium]|jgi:sugar/nucleoside kinase (ribokinase family)|nr:hypothetical protein [Chloroflexota bacterium]
MVVVLGNLITDVVFYIESFPVPAQALQGVSRVDMGPGGGCNVAIVASRFGRMTICLGEVGDDVFGKVVLAGLSREGVNTDFIAVTEGQTPVAGVLVDPASEPAYLGYPGTSQLTKTPVSWVNILNRAEAVFVDGWIEHATTELLISDAVSIAREARVPIFFDPGPGNPRQDNRWHRLVAQKSTVLLANEAEVENLTGTTDSLEAARTVLKWGNELVVVKRGAKGSYLLTKSEEIESHGFPVIARDTTGAGDSVAGAIIHGYLLGLSLVDLGLLGNATGAAKVQKIGTGHNLPSPQGVREVLTCFGKHVKLD